jgi:hypothetical protein
MNTNFKHDTLLYAAVCTGSYKSYLDLRLIQKLGFENIITSDEYGVRTVQLPVYFPEAVPHPASSRSNSPAPQLPALTVDFQVVDHKTSENDKAIQIFIGSDVLRSHSADIMFSSNSMTLFDDERSKLSIPLVRPEDASTFNTLVITSGVSHPARDASTERTKDLSYLNGLGQGSSGASVSSAAASPPPGRYRPPGVIAAEAAGSDSTKGGAPGSDSDARPGSRQSTASRPSLSLINTRSEAQDHDTGAQTAPLRSGSSPAIWSNWRRDGNTATTPQPSSLDWAGAGKNRESAYQRKESGVKILKPKIASRTVSSTATTGPSASLNSPADGKSRFFDEGRRRSEVENKAKENQNAAESTSAANTGTNANAAVGTAAPKTKSNPIGGASAFTWLSGGGGGGAGTGK